MEEQKKAANNASNKKQNSQPQKKKNNNKSNAETLKIVQDQVDNELAKVKANNAEKTNSKKGKQKSLTKEKKATNEVIEVIPEPKKDTSLQKIPEQSTVVYSSAKPNKHTKLVVSLS